MRFYELLLIAIGLSMDAFAVSICKGLSMKSSCGKNAAIIGLFFGGFQALMPLIGWALGCQFESVITEYDHWIAFALLLFIGGKMVIESMKPDDENEDEEYKLDIKELFLLAIATSIDALAVGVTFAFLQVSIVPSITLIGITTFLFSFAGVYIGNKFGLKFKSGAELAGGVILVLIGVKILLEHLGILNF